MREVGHERSAWGVVTGLLYEIRPWQWYKQSMLLLGIVFSRNLFSPNAWVNVSLGVISFCAVAGTTYIYNDISDREEDRNHPRKKHRPIASGQVGVRTATAFGATLFVLGLAVATKIGPLFLTVIIVYLVQNLFYSLFLKEVVIVDVLVISVGFVLRAIAGVVAINVYLSPWLVVCSFLAALLLAVGKRRHEIAVSRDASSTRKVLADYNAEQLDQLLVTSQATLLISYSLYTFFRASDWMMMTLPMAFFAVFRYHYLVRSTGVNADPAHLLQDRPFLGNLMLWTLTAVSILYGLPSKLLGMIA